MFSDISIHNPTGRKTEARRVDIGNTSLFFSYNTLIAVQSPTGNGRRTNEWGPTSGRHFNEMDCARFPVVSEEDLRALATLALITQWPS